MTQGEVLRGNASNQYELLARLAQGGMAEIFLARANGLAGFERYVVLKRIRPERDDDPRWVTMFLDEARLAAQLQHPNVAQVFDLGQIGDSFFYTMEFVHGEDVLDLLSRTSALGQRMPLPISLGIAAGALTGLGYAHERVGIDGRPLNIVHRDISPANLMVSFDGVVKVLDFGVAKARNRDTKTEAGTIMGKVAYLSPEQCQTNQIDHRSDLFSLGIVLYEMITHVRPFKRGTDYETLSAIVRFDPPPPSAINPALPPAIDELVMRALAKDPRQRYANAHDMLEAIEAVADVAQASLAPRDLKRYMRDLYGTPPEPWRTIGGPDEVMGTFSGEVIGPLPTETRIKAFPADAIAADVPLLPLARASVVGTPGAHHSMIDALGEPLGDDLDDAALTPHVAYRPVPARLPTDDLVDAAPTPIDMQPIRVHPTIQPPPPIVSASRATPAPRVTGPLPRVSAAVPVPTPPSGLPVRHTSGPMLLPTPPGISGPMPAVSAQMPGVGGSGQYTAPPGTIELVAPPSAIRALDTAPIRALPPGAPREGRRSRSPLVIVFTVLAVVGVGIGAMLALSGGETAQAPAASAAPAQPTTTPTVTPIEEPTEVKATEPPVKAAEPPAKVAEPEPVTTAEPATTEPTKAAPTPVTTTKPAVTTTKPPVPSTTTKPAVTTTTTAKPPTTTPPATTKPATTTKPKDKPKKPSSCTDPLECMN